MSDKELIEAWINHPKTIELANQDLGAPGRFTVDWEKREIVAQGRRAHKRWGLDALLRDLREMMEVH